MSDDNQFLKNLYHRRDRSASNEQETIIIQDNNEKNRLLREVLSKINLEVATVRRQDVISYRLTFPCYTQALSMIIGFLLILNGLIFLTVRVPTYLSQEEVLSWVLFGEAGALFILSGLGIPRRSVTFANRNTSRKINPQKRNLTFAFTHTITWFTAAICLAIISSMIYFSYVS